MFRYVSAVLLALLLVPHGCSNAGSKQAVHLKYTATGSSPEVLAVYEAWFGMPDHITISYTSHDPDVIRRQMEQAKARGISAFVVDWYGDRQPFIDKSYALMQSIAAKNNFHIAMMYDETNHQDDATDEAIADFTMFHDTYLGPKSPGRQAYLTYDGRPVIFVFPKGGHTNWDKVRAVVNQWKHPPLLIQENLPGEYADALDGFYAWVNPGPKGWKADGSDWGEQYLSHFYETMVTKYPNKMIVGGAWAEFNDTKARWSLNRHIAARCGQTFQDTFNFWKKYVPANEPIPFVLIGTWNDYEEGSAVERGISPCGNQPLSPLIAATQAATKAAGGS